MARVWGAWGLWLGFGDLDPGRRSLKPSLGLKHPPSHLPECHLGVGIVLGPDL